MYAQPPPLLRLPPELRLQIYEHVFDGAVFRIQYHDPNASRKFRSISWSASQLSPAMTAPGLLLASKQLYAEANTIYYQRASFRSGPHEHAHLLGKGGYAMHTLAHWLGCLSPAARQSLEDVQMEFLVCHLWRSSPHIEKARRSLRDLCQIWVAHTEELLSEDYEVTLKPGVLKVVTCEGEPNSRAH